MFKAGDKTKYEREACAGSVVFSDLLANGEGDECCYVTNDDTSAVAGHDDSILADDMDSVSRVGFGYTYDGQVMRSYDG